MGVVSDTSPVTIGQYSDAQVVKSSGRLQKPADCNPQALDRRTHP
jgi:hypothetical protein